MIIHVFVFMFLFVVFMFMGCVAAVLHVRTQRLHALDQCRRAVEFSVQATTTSLLVGSAEVAVNGLTANLDNTVLDGRRGVVLDHL